MNIDLDTTIPEETSSPVEDAVDIGSPSPVAPTDKPAPRKRGRKPKAESIPAPIPEPAPVPVKARKRRSTPRPSAASNPAFLRAQAERSKCIEEMAKIMEQWKIKEARLQSLDWKISTLVPQSNPPIHMPFQMPQASYPQAGYAHPYAQSIGGSATRDMMSYNNGPIPGPVQAAAQPYIPPSQRGQSPHPSMTGGGALDTIIEEPREEEDMFLKGGGPITGGNWA